jgi:hypothetical protein
MTKKCGAHGFILVDRKSLAEYGVRGMNVYLIFKANPREFPDVRGAYLELFSRSG